MNANYIQQFKIILFNINKSTTDKIFYPIFDILIFYYSYLSIVGKNLTAIEVLV